jgi:hypothetical protein
MLVLRFCLLGSHTWFCLGFSLEKEKENIDPSEQSQTQGRYFNRGLGKFDWQHSHAWASLETRPSKLEECLKHLEACPPLFIAAAALVQF